MVAVRRLIGIFCLAGLTAWPARAAVLFDWDFTRGPQGWTDEAGSRPERTAEGLLWPGSEAGLSLRSPALTLATEATNKAFELALAQYKEDVIDFQRVIDSQRALVQQQDALAEARGKVAMHLVTIYKALGGGWQPAMVAAGAAGEMPEMPPRELAPEGGLPGEPLPDGVEIVPPGTRGRISLPGDVTEEPPDDKPDGRPQVPPRLRPVRPRPPVLRRLGRPSSSRRRG